MRYACLSCTVRTNSRMYIKDHAAVLGHLGWEDRGEGLGTGLPNDVDYADIELRVLEFLNNEKEKKS